MLRSTNSIKREAKPLSAIYPNNDNRRYHDVSMRSAEGLDDIETASAMTDDSTSRAQHPTKDAVPAMTSYGRRSFRKPVTLSVRSAVMYAFLFGMVQYVMLYLPYRTGYSRGYFAASKIRSDTNTIIKEAPEQSRSSTNLEREADSNNDEAKHDSVFDEILSKLDAKSDMESINKHNNIDSKLENDSNKKNAKLYSHENNYNIHSRKHSHNGLDPGKWETFKRRELKNYFGCRDRSREQPPVITKRNWQYFRDLYNQYESAYEPNDVDIAYKLGNESYVYPIESVMTSDKGRGLIASRDIAKGERIFQASNNTIVFGTGHSWRKLLWHLYHAPPPPDEDGYTDGFACDLTSWSWNQKWPSPDGPIQIIVDIDESSLLNKPSYGEDANIQCGLDEDSDCGMDYYATMDIKKGDEILCSYSDFSTPKWHKLGL